MLLLMRRKLITYFRYKFSLYLKWVIFLWKALKIKREHVAKIVYKNTKYDEIYL